MSLLLDARFVQPLMRSHLIEFLKQHTYYKIKYHNYQNKPNNGVAKEPHIIRYQVRDRVQKILYAHFDMAQQYRDKDCPKYRSGVRLYKIIVICQ